jgi:hypothetical protein
VCASNRHIQGAWWGKAGHQQKRKALVLWFGLVVLVGKKLMVQTQIYDKKYIMGHLWFKAKWSSGTLVILLVWSGLVGSGLALIWSCGKTNQSLLVFLMRGQAHPWICPVARVAPRGGQARRQRKGTWGATRAAEQIQG